MELYCCACRNKIKDPNEVNKYCVFCRNSIKPGRLLSKSMYRIKCKQQREEIKTCCVRCGYNKCKQVLHYHHTNISITRSNPEFKHIDKMNLKQLQEMIDSSEIILLCANCHIEEHQTFDYTENRRYLQLS